MSFCFVYLFWAISHRHVEHPTAIESAMLPGVHPRGDTAKGHSVLPGFGYFTWLYLMMCPFQIPIYIYIYSSIYL